MKGIEILELNNSEFIFDRIKKEILSNKINFTEFLVWYIEEYPKSFLLLSDDINSQFNFKLK